MRKFQREGDIWDFYFFTFNFQGKWIMLLSLMNPILWTPEISWSVCRDSLRVGWIPKFEGVGGGWGCWGRGGGLKPEGGLYLFHMGEYLTKLILKSEFKLIFKTTVNLKKCRMWEFQVKLSLRQNEDCSPGGSTSDNSEKLLQRGRGESNYMCNFGEGGVHAIKHTFFAEGVLLVIRSSHHYEGF